ncbi:hypothetical protein PRUPE_1G281500 [Prunus persica]|uniref:Glycosyltransferase 61 catalytic domain-containing protein n=1 Tax=Prunus persica TaxID=3760 RepID=A0A251R4C8_PRUPE|nr:protein O-linked-mannose beta-1,4-N-acetylglucosaminyltransferase 2 [Prunus persica]XP_020418127.1 protein O-linked-mannose beta-1,4-N-acetylglucosaminyltransferase 2 [Prunus persica]XP_020418133.1 protein O-linked-mannose beta-1,4-N-acetylglucosaminyltransferase 2 [Prunus persica]ONI30921.1 hypothetical protein PRUPE_1G281500 [Prunus persica]ONI30922.1 hypothetical protein PRUPE_1G281500 [Prunus persica]
MKKTVSRAALVGVALCLFFIIFQISVSSTSRFLKYATNSAKPNQEEGTRKLKVINQPNSHPPKSLRLRVESPIICDRTDIRYDLCSINGPTFLDPAKFTFFIIGSAKHSIMEKVQPYPRKFEKFIMPRIKNLTLTSGPQRPPCKVPHNVPALVFSAGGYTGNFFHDFNDGFIPLFITVHTIFHDQDFVIVVSEAPNWWPSKYADLLTVFTKHPIIVLKNDTPTHCFPSAKIGLISHGFMTINQTLLPNSKTFLDFRVLLDRAYTPQAQPKVLTSKDTNPRPKLVLASRKEAKGRSILNQEQVIRLIKKVGFDVVVFKPKNKTPLNESYALLNSSHAMVGVHGAALTHSLFLRPGAVLVQVVPIGVEWAAYAFFGRVAKGLNLQYSEYKIGVEESSLVSKYGKGSLLVKEPFALQKTGWDPEIMDIYLKEQNVKLDLIRFKACLKKAYIKAKRFMEANG